MHELSIARSVVAIVAEKAAGRKVKGVRLSVGKLSGVEVDEWLKQGASDNHYYATTDATQAPVRYMEHKNGKLKQWDFKTYSPKAPAATPS